MSTKYEALSARVAEWTASPEGQKVIKAGKAFGKKVKAQRIAAAPAIAAEREAGTTKDVIADEYGMSTGSVGNYAMLGLLMLADDKVDAGAAYTFVTKNDGAPNLAEVRQAADERIAAGAGDVLAILAGIVADRLAESGSGDGDGDGETDEEIVDKARTYFDQAGAAMVNLLKDATDVSSLTMDEVAILASQVANLAERVRKAQPKAA